jgi:probable DNA metabolism protein
MVIFMSDIIKINFYLAWRNKNYKKELEDKVRKQNPALVSSFATKESRKLYELHTNVSRAICKIKSFLRFEISQYGILYTKIESEHNIVDTLLHFFHNRFPIFHIAIEDKNKTHIISPNKQIKIYNKNLKDTIELLKKELPIQKITMELTNKESELDESLWETYYDSQFIKERKNHKLMNSLMPKKYRFNKELSSESIISKRCKRLDEFS